MHDLTSNHKHKQEQRQHTLRTFPSLDYVWMGIPLPVPLSRPPSAVSCRDPGPAQFRRVPRPSLFLLQDQVQVQDQAQG